MAGRPQPAVKPSRLAIGLLFLVLVAGVVSAVLGGVLTTWIEPALRPYKWPIVLVFSISAVVVIGYQLRERVFGLTRTEEIPADLQARNRRAMI